ILLERDGYGPAEVLFLLGLGPDLPGLVERVDGLVEILQAHTFEVVLPLELVGGALPAVLLVDGLTLSFERGLVGLPKAPHLDDLGVRGLPNGRQRVVLLDLLVLADRRLEVLGRQLAAHVEPVEALAGMAVVEEPHTPDQSQRTERDPEQHEAAAP